MRSIAAWLIAVAGCVLTLCVPAGADIRGQNIIRYTYPTDNIYPTDGWYLMVFIASMFA